MPRKWGVSHCSRIPGDRISRTFPFKVRAADAISCHKPAQAGVSNVSGLFAVARHSGLRSGLASANARRTPAASKSWA